MHRLFSTLDERDAWLPYEVNAKTWSRPQAAHFFRRAGFGGTVEQLDHACKSSPSELVDQWLDEPPTFAKELQAIERTVLAGQDPKRMPPYWLYRMHLSPAQLLEKLTLFWHGHFATSAEKVDDVKSMLEQNHLLRRHATGSFRDLVRAVSSDPAMLVYLDSTDNRKTHPNENYARELLELFCLGVGNYTEHDVQELARCFTGWEVRRGRFRFNRYQHDPGTKSLFGHEAQLGGEEAIDLILAQPACSRFIVRKLLRFFIADEIDWPESYVVPLQQEFSNAGFDLKPVVRRILSSRVMFSPEVRGARVRSPVELSIGFLRCFGATTDLNRLVERLRSIGQVPFYPPSVKGWDGGRSWINTSTMLGRVNLIDALLFDEQTQWRGGDLAKWLSDQQVTTTEAAIRQFSELLFSAPPSQQQMDRIEHEFASLDLKSHTSVARLLHTLIALPQFQLC